MSGNRNSKYREYMVRSLNHPSYTTQKKRRKILKQLLNSKIINKDESINDMNLIDIVRDDDTRLGKVINKIEEYEFYNDYTYAFIYSLAEQDGSLSFDDFASTIKEIVDNSIGLNPLATDWLNTIIEKPTFLEDEENIFFKFSLVKHKLETGKDGIKHPIVCQFYKKLKIVTLFFNKLPSAYAEDIAYIDNANTIKRWFKNNFNINLIEFNSFRASSNLWNEREKDPIAYKNITEFTEHSLDSEHGVIKLKANKKNKLAMMDNLRDVVKTFESENDKQKMLDFFEKYKNSNIFLKRGLTWHWEYGTSQTSKISVEFKKNYLESGKTLIHFRYHNQSKERIDHVINDIKEHRELPPRAITTE